MGDDSASQANITSETKDEPMEDTTANPASQAVVPGEEGIDYSPSDSPRAAPPVG